MPVYSKVKAAGLGGLVATIIVAILGVLGVEVSPEVAAAIATLVAFIMGFFKTETVGNR